MADGKLTFNQRKAIERFISAGAKKFELIYSFTRNGASATTFHQCCDDQGPTVTVIYNTKGSIYGGYIQKSWCSVTKGTSFSDNKAFLFRLEFDGKHARDKFPVKNARKAFYCMPTYGPTFGSGHDLLVFHGDLTASSGVYTLNGTTSFGTDFDMGGISNDQITGGITTVSEVEVYKVKESISVSATWRECPGWSEKNLNDMKRFATSFSPPHGIDIGAANILVIGPVNAGKSSFFNTIASVFRDNISDQAVCGSAEKSVTSKYRIYSIRAPGLEILPKFRLCDTMGLEENQGIDGQELLNILEGHVPDGYQFNPSTPISSDVHGFIRSPSLANKIHCVCFVFDGNTVTVLSEKMLEKVKDLQAKVRQRGIPQVIVLTKIDNVCHHVQEDITRVYQSETIKNLVDQVSNIFGVPRNCILPMKNYEAEIEVRTDVSLLAMYTLKRLLLSTENHLLNYLDTMEKDMSVVNVSGRVTKLKGSDI